MWLCLPKPNAYLPSNPVLPRLCKYTKEMSVCVYQGAPENKYRIFIENNPKRRIQMPLNRRMNKSGMVYAYNMEYYTSNKEWLLRHTTKRIYLTNIILNKLNQSKKSIYYDFCLFEIQEQAKKKKKYSNRRQHSRDLFRKREHWVGRRTREPGGLLLDLDVGDSYSRIYRLKCHKAVFNISALYVFYVFYCSKKKKTNKNKR